MIVSPQTYPALPWQPLVFRANTARGPFVANYPWVKVALVPLHDDTTMIYAYSERTGQTYQRPCSTPGMAPFRAVDWARQHGG
jgi:hypothetical protein